MFVMSLQDLHKTHFEKEIAIVATRVTFAVALSSTVFPRDLQHIP
jgi:hypothetical protein